MLKNSHEPYTAGTWERSEVVAMMSTLPFASSVAYLNAG
jgi:hypothetical protein